MDAVLEYGLLAFTSLFAMINPVGVAPVYVSMTSHLKTPQARQVAGRATLFALFLLVLFALTGQLIFDLFNITVDSLRVAGGIIVFNVGWNMLQARNSPTNFDDDNEDMTYALDMALTPIGIPIIAGPGAIATMIVLTQDAPDMPSRFIVYAVVAAILVLTYLVLISGERLMRFLGENGSRVMTRLMGLIVMVIAVEFFFSGLSPILRDIFYLTPPT